MDAHENLLTFASRNNIALAENSERIHADNCETHVAYIASQMKNPKREHIEKILLAADFDHFTQVFYTHYEEVYIAGPDGVIPWAAHAMLEPGYQTEFHQVLLDGTIQVVDSRETGSRG